MRKIKEYGFILIFAIAFLALLGMYQIVDGASTNGTVLSEEAYQYCFEVGEKNNISPFLLMAIVETESSGNQNARRGDCVGLMQVSETYHTGRAARLGVSIYDERGNIETAGDYLRELFEQYEDVAVVLMEYNGDSRADAFMNGECDMSGYAERILNRSDELQREYYGE